MPGWCAVGRVVLTRVIRLELWRCGGDRRSQEEEDCDIELGGCKGGDTAQAADGAGRALSSYKKGLDCAGARRVCMERGGEPLRLVWRIREE